MDYSTEDSIRFTFATVGVALFTTTISLAPDFLVLFSSSLQVTSKIGILSAITIVIELIVDLLLPSILMILNRIQKSSN